MKYTYIENIADFVDKEVEIRGWVYNKRSSGKIQFLMVRDGTGIIQGVATEKDTEPESFSLMDNLDQESSVIVRGRVREDKRAPIGYELSIGSLEVVGESKDYPITPKSHGVDFLLQNRHIWIRSSKQWAILRIRAEVVKAVEDYLWERGFMRFDAPIFTPSACEGTTTLFEVDYFGEPAYLSQSGQLYCEATASAFGRVYCFGPAFRAEKSKTRRHLTEFWQVEPEIAYAHLDDSIELASGMIEYLIERVLINRKRELEVLERNISLLEGIKSPFPRIRYKDAVKKVNELGESMNFGEDFGAPQETVIGKNYDSPVVVTHFPREIKAFYMRKEPGNEELTLSFDILAPEGYGEIVGGGEREFEAEKLKREIKERGLGEDAFKWYIDLRKYGSVPHAGFGLGIERTVAWLCGITHIRQTIPFPRTLGRAYP
ncbi:asparagine--tRNA ligase [candidate division WOR-3 bacterium]|nr:asparagine--tRNA ligase [candidate division WOR-3 bacterium]